MTQADVVAEVKAALAPKEVFVVARSAFGGLVAAVAAPPAERLQGSVAEFLEEQLRSARATATGARADRMAKAVRKVGELEWALEQSGASRAPAVVSQVATSTESVQVCEVTEAARLIDQIDPLWLSMLLPARLGGEVLYESEAWQSLRAQAEAQLDAFVGEQLLRRCARAAFGRCKALLGKARDKKKTKTKTKTKKNEPQQQEEEEGPEVPAAAPRGAPSPTEALAEWRAIVTLLCAAEAASMCSGHVVPAVPASVRSAFARQPKGVVGSGSQCKGEGVSCAEVAGQVAELEAEVGAEVVTEVEALCAAYWEAVEAAGAGGDAPAQKGRVLRRCDPNFKPNPNPNPYPRARPRPHPHPYPHHHPHPHPNQVRAARGLARCPGGAARGRPHAAARAASRAASRAAARAAA